MKPKRKLTADEEWDRAYRQFNRVFPFVMATYAIAIIIQIIALVASLLETAP